MNAKADAPIANSATASVANVGATAATRIITPMVIAREMSRRYETPRRDATDNPPMTAPAPMIARSTPKPPASVSNVLVAMSPITTWKLNASVPITAIINSGVRTKRSDHA